MAEAAVLMVGGSLVSAYGQMQQGYAAKSAAEFNANIAKKNAELVRKQAAEEERKLRYQAKKHFGDMRASMGASGIQLDGSALDVLQESVSLAQQDALAVRHQGELKAWGFEQEARLQKYQGEAAVQGAQFGAAASILSGTGQAYTYGKRG
jgi:hypothetical protein